MKTLRKIGNPIGNAARQAYRLKAAPIAPEPVPKAAAVAPPAPAAPMHIVIPANVIRAALIHAATGDVRYYLNGILIEPTADGAAVFVVATDGHRMIAVKVDQDEPIPLEHRSQMILDRASIERAVRGVKVKSITLTGVVTETDKEGPKDVPYCKAHSHDRVWSLIEIIGGRFPDWKEVIKRPGVAYAEDVAPIYCLNPHYVLDAIKANNLLLGSKDRYSSDEIVSRKPGAAIVNYSSGNAIGVIMGMRGSNSSPTVPDFVAEILAAGKPKAQAGQSPC